MYLHELQQSLNVNHQLPHAYRCWLHVFLKCARICDLHRGERSLCHALSNTEMKILQQDEKELITVLCNLVATATEPKKGMFLPQAGHL